MSTTATPPSRPAPAKAPVGMIIMLGIGAFLELLMVSMFGDSRTSDAAGRGMAEGFAVVAAILLWIVLAILLLIGAARGRMPLAATLAAIVLLPVSAFGAVEAIAGYGHGEDWLIVVPVLLPPVFAGYALWARLPQLHGTLKPIATTGVTGVLIVVLTAAPFAAEWYASLPNPERDARLAAEAKARQEAEEQREREARAEEAAAFAKLGPDSSLMDYMAFPYGTHTEEIAAAMKKVKTRQSDILVLLRQKPLHDVPGLLNLDLEPTPELCQAYGEALAGAASRISPKIRTDYSNAAIELEYEVKTIQWLGAHDCNLDEALTLAATNIRAVADSDRLTKFAARLETLRKAK